MVEERKIGFTKFQFHTGSIKSEPGNAKLAFVLQGFNSTLVQLKGSDLSRVGDDLDVSIPHWFN